MGPSLETGGEGREGDGRAAGRWRERSGKDNREREEANDRRLRSGKRETKGRDRREKENQRPGTNKRQRRRGRGRGSGKGRADSASRTEGEPINRDASWLQQTRKQQIRRGQQANGSESALGIVADVPAQRAERHCQRAKRQAHETQETRQRGEQVERGSAAVWRAQQPLPSLLALRCVRSCVLPALCCCSLLALVMSFFHPLCSTSSLRVALVRDHLRVKSVKGGQAPSATHPTGQNASQKGGGLSRDRRTRGDSGSGSGREMNSPR